jgi:hypothetical protein
MEAVEAETFEPETEAFGEGGVAEACQRIPRE